MRLFSARIKICQILHVNFETTSQFLFKFCIILHCHDNSSSVNFKPIHILLWIKGSQQSPKSQVSWWKIAIFLVSFSKPQVSFSLNFASHFSVMKDNSNVIILCTKGTNQSGNFENFECSGQNSPNSCHFSNN